MVPFGREGFPASLSVSLFPRASGRALAPTRWRRRLWTGRDKVCFYSQASTLDAYSGVGASASERARQTRATSNFHRCTLVAIAFARDRHTVQLALAFRAQCEGFCTRNVELAPSGRLTSSPVIFGVGAVLCKTRGGGCRNKSPSVRSSGFLPIFFFFFVCGVFPLRLLYISSPFSEERFSCFSACCYLALGFLFCFVFFSLVFVLLLTFGFFVRLGWR